MPQGFAPPLKPRRTTLQSGRLLTTAAKATGTEDGGGGYGVVCGGGGWGGMNVRIIDCDYHMIRSQMYE